MPLAAQPQVVLASAGYAGKDALPRLVARLGTGMGSEVTDLRAEGGAVIGRRPLYAGKLYADVKVTGRPAVFSVPRFALELVLGKELAASLVFASARVLPARLEQSGFEFRHPDIESALRSLLDRPAQ